MENANWKPEPKRNTKLTSQIRERMQRLGEVRLTVAVHHSANKPMISDSFLALGRPTMLPFSSAQSCHWLRSRPILPLPLFSARVNYDDRNVSEGLIDSTLLPLALSLTLAPFRRSL